MKWKTDIERYRFRRTLAEVKLKLEEALRLSSDATKGSMANRPLRVVVAKAGLDGHDRGAKVIARALRDAGMEVIYTGLFQTPEQIVQTAIQEDADGIGLSILSGAHMTLFPLVVEQLNAQDAGDIVFFGGGTIPADDANELEASRRASNLHARRAAARDRRFRRTPSAASAANCVG